MKTGIKRIASDKTGSAHTTFFNPANSGGFFTVQPKLNMGQAGDKFEQETDTVAEKMVAGESDNIFFGSSVPRSVSQGKSLAAEITPVVQKKDEEEEEMLQPKMERAPLIDADSKTENHLQKSKGSGQPLENDVRQKMETGFGSDFSSVRVHTDSAAVQLSRNLGAQAFTTGDHIYFNSGKFNPGNTDGQKLLAHELTHTIQQNSHNSENKIQNKDEEQKATELEAVAEPKAAVCSEKVTKEKDDFKKHGIYGPQSTKLEWGGFDASYDPQSEDLNIVVRGKTKFKDGLTIDSSKKVINQDGYLEGLARVLNYLNDEVLNNTIVSTYYSWSDKQKEAAKQNFRDRLTETIALWQAGGNFIFQIAEPCWDDVWAMVKIALSVLEEGSANNSGTGKDHIQVNLVKNPERTEIREVNNLISASAKRIGDERKECIDTSASLTTTSNVSYSNEMTLTNSSLRNTPGEARNFDRSMLRMSVFFENNEWILDEGDKKTIDDFLKEYKNVDKNNENSKVSLIGHASKSGTSEYNSVLVDKRLDSVYNYVKGKGLSNIDSRKDMDNQSDYMAEKYDKENKIPEYLRRVELVVGSGELQNTVAHEFGHVFKLDDEYVTPKGEEGSGKPLGDKIPHSKMSEDIGAGEVFAEENDNIMSLGNEVRAQHYGPFGKMLNTITGKDWKIFSW